jgi:hypothetical protein
MWLQRPKAPEQRVLILIPGSVNYFSNLSGRRVAEALLSLGYQADVRTLEEYEPAPYEACIVSNLAEVVHSCGDEAAGIHQVRAIRRSCRRAACLTIDCVCTHWYYRLHELCARTDLDLILDLGLYDQTPWLDTAHRDNYRFVFSGLTPSEGMRVAEVMRDGGDRPIPWAFIGHNTFHRAALVDQLIQNLCPEGFVYLPGLAPYKEKGSPHLNQQQFEAVLRRTRYQLWCSHHNHFYMEPERFRTSLLTGSVPIKVVDGTVAVPKDTPFRYLLMGVEDLASRAQPDLFPRIRRQFSLDFQACPTLAEGLSGFLTEMGLSPAASAAAQPYRQAV